MSLSLRQVRYFVAAAEAGTIAGGAASSHVSQSAIALAIGQLEKTLDVQLFLRHKAKGLTITRAGAAVLADARSLLSHADELVTSARNMGQELSGPLVIGCYTTIAPFLMPIALEGFGIDHPTVQLSFTTGSQGNLQARLVDGTIELALLYELKLEPSIHYDVLYRTRPHVLLPAEHRLANGSAVSLHDLADQPMIMLNDPPSQQYFTQLMAALGIKPRIQHNVTSFETVRSLVARDLGYSLLIQRPTSCNSYEGLPLAHCDIAEPIPDMSIVIAWPAGAKLTRRAKAFARFCHRAFPQYLPAPMSSARKPTQSSE